MCVCLFLAPPALPHYKLFETQAQLIVVTEEFGIRRDLIQKDLRHLQRALRKEKEAGDKNKDAGLDGGKEKLSGGRKEPVYSNIRKRGVRVKS